MPAGTGGSNYLSSDAPELVRSLILLEPALLTVPSAAELAAATQPAAVRYEAGDLAGAVDAFWRVIHPAWRSLVAEAVPGGVEQAEQNAPPFFELELPAVLTWTLDEDKAGGVTQPVLYLWGSDSGAMLGAERLYEEGRDLVRSWFPQTEAHRVEGATHLLQIQHPQAVAEGIAAFLGRHTSR